MKRAAVSREDHFVVMNQDGEVYSGMKAGQFQYTADWSKAKPLPLSNTAMLMAEPRNELVKEEDLV